MINFEAPAPAAAKVNVWASAVTDISDVFNASISRPPAVALISIASDPVPVDAIIDFESPAPAASIVTC